MKKRICNKTINFEMNTIKGIIRIISGNIQDSVLNGPAFLLTPAVMVGWRSSFKNRRMSISFPSFILRDVIPPFLLSSLPE